MKRKLGFFLMVLGLLLMVSALSLFLYNKQEEIQANQSAAELVPKIVVAINERQTDRFEEDPVPTIPLPPEEIQQKEMTVVEIDGYGYIGFLSIPSLNLELPVMTDWSYPQLKISPCRYTGSVFSDDLVVMAHNYARHFGTLSDLRPGETVIFADMDAQTITYEVVAVDILAPTAVEEMTAGEYDLTLFTCTYGGKSRVTVRCNRVEE